ncbi:MAG: hypothetical protein WBA74_09860 [Cyclobacteriaceae bacterium]
METIFMEFEEFKSEIESTDKAEILEFEFGFEKYTKSELNSMNEINQERYGFNLSEDDIQILAIDSESVLRWELLNNETEVFGGFRLIGIPAAISMKKFKVQVYNEDLDADTAEILAKASYFDIMPGLESKVATIVTINEVTHTLDLWYLNDSKVEKILLSPIQYINALFRVKGFFHWQYLFCDIKNVKKNIESREKESILKIKKFLPEAFPGINHEYIIGRVDKLINN